MIVLDSVWPNTSDWDNHKELLYHAYSWSEMGNALCLLIGVFGFIRLRESHLVPASVLGAATVFSGFAIFFLSHGHT
jgi:hypothetical protein